MKMPDKEKLFKELTDLITLEQEKEFFVLCELKKNPGFSTGGLKRNNNGYDDCGIGMNGVLMPSISFPKKLKPTVPKG